MDQEFKWDADSLYSKAVLFASYAHSAASDSPLFGLWSSLSVELLARAGLAKIHPSLLADPRDHENILYGFGVRTQREPLSIPARTVFSRCRLLLPKFDEAAEAHCQLLAGIRNRELHTGEGAFESLVHNRWLADHYRVVMILINHLDGAISDFFAPETVRALQGILEERNKEVEARAKRAVATRKKCFENLTAAEQALLIEESKPQQGEGASDEFWSYQVCPACGNQGVLSGSSIQNVHTSLDGDELVRRYSILSSSFRCDVCQLTLSTHNDVYFAGLPSTFEATKKVDPLEHFGINPEDYFDIDDMARILERSGLYVVEPDYGNE